MKKIRNSNFELLRILLTFMIIALHYTAQSGARDLPVSYNFIFTILVSSAGRMAVSCFVILGAFFLVDLDFRFERIVRIWLQSLFYTTIIHLILKYFKITEVPTKTLVMSLLPFYGLSLWYVSYYIGLLFLSPFLNVLIKNLSHQLYVALLVILLTLGSIIPSLIHLGGPLEHPFIWFCTLYLLAGYLKKYSFSVFEKQLNCILIFFLNYMFICGYWIFGRKFGWQVNLDFYSGALNSVPSLLCAISLFYYFKNLNIGSNKIINTLAASSLGIYIIHQVPLFYPVLWNQIIKVPNMLFSRLYIPFSIIAILGVYMLGFFIDYIRRMTIEKWIMNHSYMIKLCNKVNKLFQVREIHSNGDV